MADSEVASRAPESDAQEDASTQGGKVDQGASLGEHCTSDRPTRMPLESSMAAKEQPLMARQLREFTKLADVDVYITKPADYPHNPGKLLLLLGTGTGIHSINNQLQADKFAGDGFLVVMPDQFGGDLGPQTGATVTGPAESSFIETVKLRAAETVKSFQIDMWLARHTPATVMPILQKVIPAIREEFADAVANGDGIYGVGYCFGGKYILLLASELDDDVAHGQREQSAESQAEQGMVKKGPAIKAGVLAHGTLVSKSDFKGVQVPVGMVCVEDDALFPDDVREHGVKALKERNVEVQDWVHPGVPHGFAVIGEYADPKIKEAQQQAHQQMLGFLQAH